MSKTGLYNNMTVSQMEQCVREKEGSADTK